VDARQGSTCFRDSDYSQIGLSYRLELAEVLFNRGLCLIYLGAKEEGIRTMQEAVKYNATPEHKVIEEAIRDGADGYTVFSIVSVPAFKSTPNGSN
jgi:neutrophil factor 2